MPKVDTTVSELVQMVRSGHLRLPEMQRRYVWPATRVRDLLDSLYRGYPSGTILVWETDKEAPSRDLAVGQEANPFRASKLLLDGQQRLTSLTAVLHGEPVMVRKRVRPIDILFNLDHPDGPPVEMLEVSGDGEPSDDDDDDESGEEGDDDGPSLPERLKRRTFVVASNALLADPHWVKVSEIFAADSDGQILRRVVKSFDDPNYDKYAKRLQKVRSIRAYPYVMHVLDKDLSYEEVAEIFVRVNSLGMKLRGSDLALAQITSRWPDSLRLFEAFQTECEGKSFTLDLGLIVRALVVFATDQCRFKVVNGTPIDKFKRAWEPCQDAVRHAINFLRANLGVEDETLLSSPMFVIALAYHGARRAFEMDAAEERALRRWLFAANARGRYTRASSETVLDSDLTGLRRDEGAAGLILRLEAQVGRLTVLPSDFAAKGQRSALFPITYLALRARGARDWQSRLALSLTHQGRVHFIQYHHIFPKALLRNTTVEKEAQHEIANMAFVSGGTNHKLGSKPAAEYLAEVMAAQGREALVAHCIPTDPELWTMEAYPDFLTARRALLAEAVNAFIAGPDEPSDGDVLAVIAGGETDTLEFKASARWDLREGKYNKAREHDVTKTIAAFQNTGGGCLFIGVQNDGTAFGIEQDIATLTSRPDLDGYQQFLITAVANALGRPACGQLTVTFHPFDGKTVCRIVVQQSALPVYLKEGQDEKFFVRHGNMTQSLGLRDATLWIGKQWAR